MLPDAQVNSTTRGVLSPGVGADDQSASMPAVRVAASLSGVSQHGRAIPTVLVLTDYLKRPQVPIGLEALDLLPAKHAQHGRKQIFMQNANSWVQE